VAAGHVRRSHDQVVDQRQRRHPIFIHDVAEVVDDAALQYNIVRVNGKRSVYCPLLREPGENTIAVVDRIREGLADEIPKMKQRQDIPEATEVTLVSDQSGYIRDAMRNLLNQVGLGALLVAVVVLIFLRRFLPTVVIVATLLVYLVLMAQFRSFVDPLIIMPAVPLGIGGVLVMLDLTGTTLNIQSVMGTLMMIGVVVNNSILLVEFANGRLADGLIAVRDRGLEMSQVQVISA